MSAQIIYGDIPGIAFHHCSKEDVEMSCQNSIWIIKEKHNLDLPPVFLHSRAKLIIVMPHSSDIENAEIRLANGCIEGNKFHGKNIRLSVCSGSVRIEKCSFFRAFIQCESGNIQLRGTIKNKAAISCKMGQVKLNCLTGEHYGYSVNVGLGSIHIRDKLFTGTSQTWAAGKTPFFDVYCEMGNVFILENHMLSLIG